MICKIAYRNIKRHKRRTILSSVTIAVGLAIYIAMDSMMTGMDQGMIDNMIQLSTGALRVTTKTYEANKQTYPLDFGLENSAEIISTLKKSHQVSGITSRTLFLGQLSNYEESVPIAGTVIDPQTDTTVFDINKFIDGSWFRSESEHEILLGSGLAQDLGVKAGDFVTLYAITRYDSRNADEFLVTGTIRSTDPTINRNSVFITYKAADNFLDLEGLATEIDVAIANRSSLQSFTKDVNEVQSMLQRNFPSLSVSSFKEIGAAFFQMSKTKQASGIIFMLIILLIAGVGIFNTVFMSVYERFREIGVLRAHGMKPSEINIMFILEGIFTGVAGSVLGLIIGSSLNYLLIVKGFPMEKFSKDLMGDFPVWGTIYGVWNIDTMIFVFIFGIIIATIASIIPARSAARLQITKALKFS